MRNRREFGLVLDFDGTIAETFTPSPSGIGVTEAYEHAVQVLFGEDALQHYRTTGGLQNHAPREVTARLLNAGFSCGYELTSATNLLVELKIARLTTAFGNQLPDGALWPRLTPGFAEFWRRASGDARFVRVILSSGHRGPIAKTFAMNGLAQPDMLVTDDDVRNLPEPLAKPDPRLWQFMLDRVAESGVTFDRAIYIGDDARKDGGLVRGLVGVEFVLFSERAHREHRTFSNWSRYTLPHEAMAAE